MKAERMKKKCVRGHLLNAANRMPIWNYQNGKIGSRCRKCYAEYQTKYRKEHPMTAAKKAWYRKWKTEWQRKHTRGLVPKLERVLTRRGRTCSSEELSQRKMELEMRRALWLARENLREFLGKKLDA